MSAAAEVSLLHAQDSWHPLLVFGSAPEVTAELARAPVLRRAPGPLPAEVPPAAALVFDLRGTSVSELAAMRAQLALAPLPLLLLSDQEIPEAAFLLLRADDGVVMPAEGVGTLRRRLAVLLELARARRQGGTETRETLTLRESRSQVASLYRMLIDRQRFTHAVLDAVPVAVITTDDEGAVTFVNAHAAELLEMDAAAAGQAASHVLMLPAGPQVLLGDDARWTQTYTLTSLNGTELELELALGRAEASRDGVQGFFFIFRDVRAEKQVEAERRRFERLAAMGTMVAGFAHEVRNPVAAMRSIMEELRDAGENLPHVDRMLGMLERIERLVRTALQFGRPATPRRAPQRPWDVVTSALTELSPRLRGRGEKLTIDADPDLPRVMIDGQQLSQVIVILLQNALDATGSASRVIMRVRKTCAEPPASASAVRFEVVDDGPGIPEAILGSIFDPFFTTKPTGTGLGLSIAQQLVSENGARLEVTSTPEEGTTFAVVVAAEGAP